ncbi:MAG: class I SAM-dependent methyltransferase [Croceitalea sp.]|nr:class I SAM-dependent methyltransferase [Croceitalea sp.]
MRKRNASYLLFIAVLMFALTACQGQTTNRDTVYEFKIGDPSGIGKWYKGREIAHIMGYQGMGWLERPEREQEEKTSKLLKNMALKPNDVVADIGAGLGYHVFKMAPQVSEGLVYAVDIQEEMLQAIRVKQKAVKQHNITPIKGTETSINLPKNTVDKVLMVDVYHEFEYPIEMLASIKTALRDNGRIYLIEYRAEDQTVPIKRLHKMSEAQAVKELNAAGFKLIENIANLPWQHCMVFGLQ